MLFLRMDALVLRLQGEGVFARVQDTGEQTGPLCEPRALRIGHFFHEVVLQQMYHPPISDTNPQPLEIWPIHLQLIEARSGGSLVTELFPGDSVWMRFLDKSGMGITTLQTAFDRITLPTQSVGLR
jgi:hypothetical protein